MTTSRDQTPRKRLLLTVAITAVVVAIAAVIFSVYLATRTPDATAVPAPTSDSTTPAPTGTGVDACLGGEELTANAIFTAQRDAARTPEGAVSFAAAFARYMLQIPAAADIDELSGWTGMSAPEWDNWQAGIAAWDGPSPLKASTINGSYVVQSFTPDEAVILLDLPWVVDGALSPERSFSPTVTLSWVVGGNWSVTGMNGSSADNAAAFTGSVPFVGGC